MKRFILFIVLFQLFSLQAYAQITNVQAGVGKYNFSVSGFVSPFASIVMTSNGTFMGSTVADGKGNFVITDVLINEGFSDFCLEAIDIKRIGDSLACLKIPPANASTSKDNIFLPPTIGLSGRTLNPTSKILASGYSMPGAVVTLNIGGGGVLTANADSDGLYKIEIKNLPSGTYILSATAHYKTRDSEKPANTLEIRSLSLAELISQNLGKILLFVLIVFVVIILLFILSSKRLRNKIKKFWLAASRRRKKKDNL